MAKIKLKIENNIIALAADLHSILEHKVKQADIPPDEIEGVPAALAIKNFIDFYLNLFYEKNKEE